jgi:tetratricopeptide (TPR) repeat protein
MNATSPTVKNPESPRKRGAVFISYRRSDSSGYAGRISKELAGKFKKVFWDRKAIAPGTDFSTAIRDAISSSSVLLVIVGPDWLRTKDADGHERLSAPEDYVRLEIRAAIDQGLRVIPVLVGGARMPSSEELPDGLRDFAKLNLFELSDIRWEYDLAKLVKLIRPIIEPWFVFRRVSLALAVLAAVIGGIVLTSRFLEHSRIEQAIAIAREGKVDEGLEILKRLQGDKPPGPINPRIYLYEAEIYQMKGDAFYQQDAAEKAVATARGDDFVVGRAKGLACDAMFKRGLAQAIKLCEQAEESSFRAKDAKGQVRAINFRANILTKDHPDDALKAYQQAIGIAQQNALDLDEYGALTNIGLILADRQGASDQRQARINFEAARNGFEHKGQLGEESNVYNLFGALNLDQGNIDAARAFFQKALDLAIQGQDQSREAQARLNQALILEQTGSLAAAETELVHALQIYEKLGQNSKTGEVSETGDIAEVKNDLGDIYLQQGRFDEARKAYGDAERIRSDLHQTGAQALSTASLVNLDLQQRGTTVGDLSDRIETAIQQATNAGDSYSESFARIIKAQLLLPERKIEAEKEARRALELAGENQADNAFSAQVVLAEIEAINGHTPQALTHLDALRASAERDQNVGQKLEARLAYLKLMKQAGQTKQQEDAMVLLAEFQEEADNMGYKLLATQAQDIRAGKA